MPVDVDVVRAVELPTRLVHGPGALGHLRHALGELGVTRPLLVTDPGVAAAGIAERALQHLDDAIVFGEVRPNPDIELVDRGAALYREEGRDGLVGLGGGSSLDTAKSIGVVAAHGGSILDYEYGGTPMSRRIPPLVAVPTTAGTGSEVTLWAVVTDYDRKIKFNVGGTPLIAPHVALIDPELMLGLPPAVTAATGMDALSHAIECYTCDYHQPFSDAVALQAIELVRDWLRRAVEDGSDLEARTHMAHAATLGGMAYGTESAGAAHAMSQSAGGVHDCPHGALTARVLGPVCEFNAPADPVRYARIAQGLGVDTGGLESLDAALAGVEALYRLTDDVGIPTMEELGFSEDEIPMLAGIAFEDPQTIGNPREVEVADYEDIYRNAFSRGSRGRPGVRVSVTTRDYSMVVGGAWVESESGKRFEATSPATGESLGTVPEGTREDALRAIAAANAARRDWAARSAFERADALNRVADLIEERRDDLARTLTLDQGKPLHAESYGEVEELVVYWRMAAADATRLAGSMPPSVDAAKRILAYRVPRGVVGVITPWNWPYTMPAELIAPALAAGNAVVWTPASSTSVCAVKLAECIVDAQLPTGVFSMVTGPGSVVGDEVASSSGTHAVGFIGSVATGHKVAAGAAGKAMVLELGGNGPMVVLDDADLETAAEASIAASFLCAGQSCTAGELFLVHESVHDEFVDRLRAAVDRSVRLGDPFAEETTMGPLNNEATAQKMDEHVADALERGAELVVGGKRASGFPTDLYWEPTVLASVTEEMEVARDETFGPVVPIVRISSDEEALQIANSSEYGLLTAVWTSDLARGLRFAEAVDAGWVNINESTNYWESHLPFGGRAGSSSGVGRVGGSSVLEAFTEPKTVVVTLG